MHRLPWNVDLPFNQAALGYLWLGPTDIFFSVADAFLMEIDKHQAMFRRYNRTFGE